MGRIVVLFLVCVAGLAQTNNPDVPGPLGPSPRYYPQPGEGDNRAIAERNRREALRRERDVFARRARDFSIAWRKWAELHNEVMETETVGLKLQQQEAKLWQKAMKSMDRLRKTKIARELGKEELP